ncbi:uncharacterized protein LOC106181418 [Lingula anatina]|uniref:Uncharacterized protein LOC106181418 n=1 Tax=Lingula anatina TaxID=7574 RepID=A0A1S3KF31_LINAN|nr:uncharacterized protein LOC106181418 [Lingula anatina]|eukprot:XP_013421245.1 uncharacterized protein LOC106181418 [Lingula anatina]
MKYIIVLVLLIVLEVALARRPGGPRGRHGDDDDSEGQGRRGRHGGRRGNRQHKPRGLTCANITETDCDTLPPMRLCDDTGSYTNWCDYMKRVKCPQGLRGKPEGLFPCDEAGAPIPKTNLGRRRHLKLQAKCARVAEEDCSTHPGPKICDSSDNSTYANKCEFLKDKCQDLSAGINFAAIFKCDENGNPLPAPTRGGRRRCGKLCRRRQGRQPE